jgi:hypothetical protein
VRVLPQRRFGPLTPVPTKARQVTTALSGLEQETLGIAYQCQTVLCLY